MTRHMIRLGFPAAAAAVVALAFLWPGSNGSGSVLAEVIQRVQSAHTVTCRTFFFQDGQWVGTGEFMFKGDRHVRVTTPEGMIYIMDHGRGRLLALDPVEKTATTMDAIPTPHDFYETLMRFRNGSETSLGTRLIDGREAAGFALPSAGPLSVWIDVQTGALIQLEQRSSAADGGELTHITRDFVLDAPLDESLFSVEVPEGYTLGKVNTRELNRAEELKQRMQSATAASNIVAACLQYASRHDGQWPDSLDALAAEGINPEALVNPRQPNLAVGWVYLPPQSRRERSNAQTLVLHEAYTDWGEGINVTFADGHVEFMKDESRFRELIGP